MTYNHGMSILENPTSITPPIQTDSGVQVIVGTAPVNLSKHPDKVVNMPILGNTYAEAVEYLGYSDDWDKYTLCQSIDATFLRFQVAPVVFINVLDPEEHNSIKSNIALTLVNREVTMTDFGVLLDTLVIKNQGGTTTYQKDRDYEVNFNKNGYPVVSVIPTTAGGTIPTGTTTLTADFKVLDPTKVTTADIIGGYDATNNKTLGLEAISQVYPKLGIVPGLVLAPGWSHKPEVASVIDAKCRKINGNFNATNVLDVDSSAVKSYQAVQEWKNQNGYTSERSTVLWPKVKIGEKVYWYSAVMAPLTAYTDAENDNVPFVSPSNKRLPITATVLADGTEVYLDQLQANYLNGAGIVTAININGWRTWGNNTAAYPSTTDPKDRFISIRRVFDWWGNTFILTYFDKVDDPTNLRLIESIVDSENIRGNGFQAKGQIAGAEIEFREEDNPIEDILGGKIQFIQRIGAFTPAENIVNVLEFDPTMVNDALFGGE